MTPLVQENLQGLVRVELTEKATGKVLFADNGRCKNLSVQFCYIFRWPHDNYAVTFSQNIVQ